jgi:hypothetical protein
MLFLAHQMSKGLDHRMDFVDLHLWKPCWLSGIQIRDGEEGGDMGRDAPLSVLRRTNLAN